LELIRLERQDLLVNRSSKNWFMDIDDILFKTYLLKWNSLQGNRKNDLQYKPSVSYVMNCSSIVLVGLTKHDETDGLPQ